MHFLFTVSAYWCKPSIHRYAHRTLDNRRPCVLCDRSSGVEHLDTARAVLWVCYNFFDVAWTLNCSHAPLQTDFVQYGSFVAQFTTLRSLGQNVVMTFRFNNNNNQKACNCEGIATQRPPDFAPVDLAYYQHFLGFLVCFVRKFVFSDVLGSSAWQPPLSDTPTSQCQISKKIAHISQWICVACYIRCDLDLWPFDLEAAYWLSRAETLY